jgi:hypothetical protein
MTVGVAADAIVVTNRADNSEGNAHEANLGYTKSLQAVRSIDSDVKILRYGWETRRLGDSQFQSTFQSEFALDEPNFAFPYIGRLLLRRFPAASIWPLHNPDQLSVSDIHLVCWNQ